MQIKKGKSLQEIGGTVRRGLTLLGIGALVGMGYYVMGSDDEGGTAVKCGPAPGTRVQEGVLSEDNPYTGFEVTTRDGKRVARVVVAASVDHGLVTVDGLQAYHGGFYPSTGWLGSNNEVVRPTNEAVLKSPRHVTSFNFIEGQGYVADLKLDKNNTVLVSAAPPEIGNTSAVQLWTTCVGK